MQHICHSTSVRTDTAGRRVGHDVRQLLLQPRHIDVHIIVSEAHPINTSSISVHLRGEDIEEGSLSFSHAGQTEDIIRVCSVRLIVSMHIISALHIVEK